MESLGEPGLLLYAFTEERLGCLHDTERFLEKPAVYDIEGTIAVRRTPSAALVVQCIDPTFDFIASVEHELEGGEEEFEAYCNGTVSRDHLADICGYYCIDPSLDFISLLPGRAPGG